MSEIILTKSDPPANPPAGKCAIYFKNDGRAYWLTEAGLETPFKTVGSGTGDLMSDGSVALISNWDVGAFQITALRFHSDEATLSPFTVASIAVVTNLNADLLDGQHAAEFASSTQGGTADTAVQPGDIDTLVKINASISDGPIADQAYVDNAVLGLLDHKGGYNASTNTPDLDVAPSGVLKGDAYIVTVAGLFFTEQVDIGDWMYAIVDSASTLADWTIVQANIDTTAFATSAQGALADTAVQPGDDIFVKYLSVNDQTGTNYGLVLGDAGALVTMSNAAANTVTIPTNASVAFPVGTQIDVLWIGVGATSILSDGDTVTGNLNFSTRWSAVTLIKIATTAWVVVGGTP